MCSLRPGHRTASRERRGSGLHGLAGVGLLPLPASQLTLYEQGPAELDRGVNSFMDPRGWGVGRTSPLILVRLSGVGLVCGNFGGSSHGWGWGHGQLPMRGFMSVNMPSGLCLQIHACSTQTPRVGLRWRGRPITSPGVVDTHSTATSRRWPVPSSA